MKLIELFESNTDWIIDELIDAFKTGLKEVEEEIGDAYYARIGKDTHASESEVFVIIQMPRGSTSPARILRKHLKPFVKGTLHTKDGMDQTWRWELSKSLTSDELEKLQSTQF